MIDVLSFGEALVDFFPERPGQLLAETSRFVRHLGGAPANVAVGLARSGARVGICTLVGADAFGDYVLSALAHEGIDTTSIGRHATAKTGVAFVAVAADGARSFLFFRHPSADMAITAEQIPEATIAGAHVLHLGSSTLAREPSRQATLHAFALAQRQGKLISIDPNLRAHLWDDLDQARTLLRPILAAAAMVKISDDELGPLLGVEGRTMEAAEEGARRLRALGCGVALVTLGERGAIYDAPCGRGHVPAIATSVVDSTGAGDAFVAGFWAELLPEVRAGKAPMTLERSRIGAAVAAGCRLGSDAVSAMGATAGIPRASDGTKPHAMAPMRAWRQVSEAELLRTRIFVVKARRLISPRTGLPREFACMECPDWCNVIALTDDDHVVMVRQVRHGTGESTLELPGGMIDPEDADPLSGALRELLEETGYAGQDARLIGVIAPNPAMQSNRCHTAIVRGAARRAEPAQDAGEDIEVVLVPYAEIPARIARGEITHALVVVAFAWALGLHQP